MLESDLYKTTPSQLPRGCAHALIPILPLQHTQLPEIGRKGIDQLRVLDIRAIDAVRRAVLGRQEGLEFRFLGDELFDKVDGLQSCRRGKMHRAF